MMHSYAVITALLLVPMVCDAASVRISIDTTSEKQVMHSFGASDAWSCQFVGKDWPLEKRNSIADLLFSTENDSKGNPKGIGLSMWRFGIGAGSAEQADKSRISSPWHRAECFLSPDGAYDWKKQQGEQWFLDAAKKRGVRYLLAFTNSPPVQFTLNGIAHSDPGHHALNIRKDAIPEFAAFLAEVAEHFKEKGVSIDYISPLNEPQHHWDSDKQEGTPASNADIYEVARDLGQELHKRGLSTKVAVAESGILYYLTWPRTGNNAADQIKTFWDSSSPENLANLPNIAHLLSAHSYFTTWPIPKQLQTREEFHRRLEEIDPKLAYWQTEFCILERNDEIGQGQGRDLGMDTALYVARVIHSDITIANASHWSWWLAVSASDFKDGLVYIEPEDGNKRDAASIEHDGRVLASKTLWALGNFSRFVRPGMVRVGLDYSDHRTPEQAAQSLMASAYLDKKTRQVVVVLINCAKQSQTVAVGLGVRGGVFETYTTSETCDLAKGSASADAVLIPARSVVTLVGETKASL